MQRILLDWMAVSSLRLLRWHFKLPTTGSHGFSQSFAYASSPVKTAFMYGMLMLVGGTIHQPYELRRNGLPATRIPVYH
jgi:hypothetical protein